MMLAQTIAVSAIRRQIDICLITRSPQVVRSPQWFARRGPISEIAVFREFLLLPPARKFSSMKYWIIQKQNLRNLTYRALMKITFAAIAPRRTRSKSEATDRLLADYIERAGRYIPCESELFDSEAAVLGWLDRQPGRTSAYAVLLD